MHMRPFNSDNVSVTPSGIRIVDKPGERPRFKREYSASLSQGRTIKVTMKTFIGSSRSSSGELCQPGDRWVSFDPDRVADKILDPALVPLVEDRCREIKKLDAVFMASKPSEFVDEAGVRWHRCVDAA